MRPISLLRFNALAGYARLPFARLAAEELAWFEQTAGDVLTVGTLIRDHQDQEFGGIIFAHDSRMRFRCVSVTHFGGSRRRAEVELRRKMEEAALAPLEDHHQDNEGGLPPVDFFTPTRSRDRLNPDFIKLVELEGYSPALEIIKPMMRWYEDADGNFVEQFQTTGFDQRIWELYLFAAFTEMGYRVDRTHAVPDFTCESLGTSFLVEAVTVAPTRAGSRIVLPPPTDTPDDLRAFLRHYMPIKFGSALFSKLRKEYWKLPNVAGKPLVFAIEDFSAPVSMIRTRSALDTYLYGYEHEWERDEQGRLSILPRRIEVHEWNGKVIPSGFFRLPGAENISAVLFSNSGTIAKFNRMGILGKFGSERVFMVRTGTAVNHDPNAAEPHHFLHIINAPEYTESWMEGLDVFHNPNALHPLSRYVLPRAGHHYLQPDGQVVSETPEWHPLASITRHFVPVDVEAMLAQARFREEAP